MNIGDIWFALRGDGSPLLKDAAAAGGKAGTTAGTSMGEKFKTAAGRGTVLAGAAIGAFVAGSVQEFAKFEEQMNEVFTLLPDMTDEAMKAMSDDVKEFSKETGKLPDEVIPALYQAISAGVPEDNVFDFLRTANKAAVAGVATTTDSVNLLAAVTKGYGDTSQEAVQKVSDLAFQTVKLGQTTYPELAAAIGQVVPLASALGVKQEELFGITATLTGVTGNTNEVMTQQKSVMTALVKQTPGMTGALRELGFETSKGAIETLGLTGTLNALRGTTDGTTESLTKIFGRAEAITAVLALTGAQSEVASEKIAQMGEASGSVDVAFDRMESGIGARTKKIAANIRVMAIDVGEQLKDLGPLFVLFGPSAGRAIGAGLGAAFAVVGKKLVAPLAKAVGGALSAGIAQAAGSSAVQAASSKIGSALGSNLGKGLAIGFAAVAVVAVVDTYNKVKAGLDEQAAVIGESVGNEIAHGSLEALQQSKAALAQGMKDLGGVWDLGLFTNESRAKLQAQMDLVDEAITRRMGDTAENTIVVTDRMADRVGGAVESMASDVQPAARSTGQALADVAASSEKMRQKVETGTAKIVAAVDKMRIKLGEEAQALIDGYYGPLIDQADLLVLKDKAAAAERALAATQAGTTQRREARLTAIQANQDLDNARLALLTSGKLSAKEQKQWLKDLKSNYKSATGDARAKVGALIDKVEELARVSARNIKITITGHAFGKGPTETDAFASGGLMTGPGWVGEQGRELWIPTAPGYVIPHAASEALAANGLGGSTTITVALPVSARPDPFETAAALRRLRDFGVLNPRPGMGV